MPRAARVPWAAFGVGAVCVPALTIVALTEEPQTLVKRPRVTSAAGSGDSRGGGSIGSGSDSNRAAAPWWLPLAQQLERLQQLAGTSPDDAKDEAGGLLKEQEDGKETGGLDADSVAEHASSGAKMACHGLYVSRTAAC